MKFSIFFYFPAPYSFKNRLKIFCSDIWKIVKDTDDFVQPRRRGKSLSAPPAETGSEVQAAGLFILKFGTK